MGFFSSRLRTKAETNVYPCCPLMKEVLIPRAYFDKDIRRMYIITKEDEERIFFDHCPYCAEEIKLVE